MIKRCSLSFATFVLLSFVTAAPAQIYTGGAQVRHCQHMCDFTECTEEQREEAAKTIDACLKSRRKAAAIPPASPPPESYRLPSDRSLDNRVQELEDRVEVLEDEAGFR